MMLIDINKPAPGAYVAVMDHRAICRLQSMLILCHNKIPELSEEDRVYLRSFEEAIMKARLQGTPS